MHLEPVEAIPGNWVGSGTYGATRQRQHLDRGRRRYIRWGGARDASRRVGQWRGYRLTLYTQAGATVEVDPIRTLGLASRLLDAAMPRLRS